MTGWLGRCGILVAVLLIVGGCAAAPAPASPGPPAAPGAPVSSGAGSPAELEAVPDDVAFAMSQRRLFGLRADEAWVRMVAADPTARISLLDFPMLPEEEAEFQARQDSYEDVAAAVNRYAEDHRDEFGGVWIDQVRHTVVAAWTRNPDLHRIAILASMGGAGPLDVTLVRYTERDLNALTDRLFADRDWYATIAAAPRSGGADIMNNRVDFEVSSANPDVAALILGHFAVPPGMLEVHSDGTGIALQPRGTVALSIKTAEGGPPGRNSLDVVWTADREDGRECGEMVGYVIPEDGTLTFPCAPGGWTITARASVGDGWADVGSGHVVVPPGGRVELVITLAPGTNVKP